MAYTTQQLISNAYYLSQIVARELETVSGSQLDDGLFRLNGFISKKDISTKLIPYYTVTEDNFVAGQEIYFIPNLVDVETFAFFIEDGSNENVRFEMQRKTREQYFGYARVDNVESLPFQWYAERATGGMNIYVYFTPDKAYPYIFTGKYSLGQLALNQDLELVFDNFFLEYLMYGLSIYLCEWYSVEPPQSVVMEFKDLESKMRAISPVDFTMRKQSYFWGSGGINYADVNIGKGWRP